MTSIGYQGVLPNNGGGLPPNKYSRLGDYPQALYVCRGTVLGGYQGTQIYDVATDFGRFLCTSLGQGLGLLGAQDASGYLPGEQVLVTVSPSAPAFNAFIIGKADYTRAAAYRRPAPLLVSPQVAGFEPGERLSGAASTEFPRIRNFNTGVLDVVDGEWVMHNMFGGAVGVEMFRVFLQAGPMCGVYGYTEDQELRIVGNQLRTETSVSSEVLGNLQGVANRVAKLYHYLNDQRNGWQAQQLELSGPLYGGENKLLTYPDGTNGANSINLTGVAGEPQGDSRIALIHEHRGIDGNYVMSAAGSITLQKTFSIPVPIDIVEADSCEERRVEPEEETEEEAEEPCADADLSGPPFDSYATSHPLAFVMNVRGLVDRITHAAISGATQFCRWGIGRKPTAIFGNPEDNTPTGLAGERSSAELLYNADPSMWKNVPQTFKLALTPDGSSKRFYWGRALISITEDGSITMQDAQGSSITLSGGNIYLSAPHDIINVAGRNKLDVAGRDMGHRAGRHVDIYANEGRLTAMAGGQTSIVGGVAGHGGLLLESKGEYGDTITTGENPPTAGSVIIKSKQMVGVMTKDIHLRARAQGWSGREDATGSIFMDVGNSVEMRTRGPLSQGASYVFGDIFAYETRGNSRGILGGPTCIIEGNLSVTGSTFISTQMRQSENAQRARYYVENILARIRETQDSYMDFNTSPLTLGDGFSARWLRSEQYNITGEDFFQIPEPEWQIRARAALPATSSALQALMIDNKVSGTAPLPGNEAWDGYAVATGGYTDTEFGEEPVVDLTIGSASANSRLLKGI